MITLHLDEKDAARMEEALDLLQKTSISSMRLMGKNHRAIRALDYNIMRTNHLRRQIRQSA